MNHAVVVGFEHHVGLLCTSVAGDMDWRLRGFVSTKLGIAYAALALGHTRALIAVGGPGPPPRLAAAARRLGVPIIVVWVGSDVAALARTIVRGSHATALNLAVAPWLSEELKATGIDAPYMPFIGVRIPARPAVAEPGALRVLAYLPQGRADFYGRRDVYECASALPGISFEVVGNRALDSAAPPNVHFRGWVDSERLYENVDVLLRLPEHDGMSMMVLEALANARHVIWNHDLPGVRRAVTTQEAIASLSELADRRRHGALATNEPGRAFVSAEYERSHVAKKFLAMLSARTLGRARARAADIIGSMVAFARKSN